ncbi:MAG: M28 family peptidase, partial [Peptostreptococcaceae bacterium]
MIKRRKVLPITLVASLMLASAAFATPNNSQKMDKIFLNRVSEQRAMNDIEILSEDIGVRVAASDEEYEAAKFIQQEFNKLGFETEIQEFKYTRNSVEYTSWNVIASKKPETKGNKVDKNDSDEIVHVTAHYDSVLKAPGANDNASGTAAMIEIAKSMNTMDIDKEVRFIACGAEEVGLRGSTAYVNSLSEDEINRSIANFNLDMVATAYEPCTELAVYTYSGNENLVTDAMKEAGTRLKHLSTDEV